ncbi:MAG: DUF4340 domain-containing protein [Clostridia bacterium]|nr:DUF4340 domain-containing protein [Clostridia bacterium]
MSDEKRPGAGMDAELKPAPDFNETSSPATDEETSTLSGPPKQVTAKAYTPHKRWRVIVAAVAAAAVLGGGLFAATRTDWLKAPAVSDTSDESAEPALDPLIDKSALGADGVVRVEIDTGDETYILQKNTDGLMTVAAFEDLPRNADAVDALRNALLTLTPHALVLETATEAELAACGLTRPAVSAAVTYADGDAFAFEIGNLEPGENAHYYFRKAGDPAVYLVEAALYQQLMKPAADYLATVLTPAPASDDDGTARLERLELSGTLRPDRVVLRRAEESDPAPLRVAGHYVIAEPYVRAVNTELVYPWETGLCDASASGVAAVHPTEKQLASFGLDEPHSVADITFAVFPADAATETSAAHTEPYNHVSYTLSLGGKNENGDYYALVDGVDAVYTVPGSAVPWAEATYGDLISSTLFLHYITDLSDITVTVNGTTSVIHLTHSGGETSDAAATFTATVGDRTMSEADTRTLYRLMMMVGRIAEEPTDAPSSALSAPSGLTLRLTFLDPDKADAVYTFYPYSANRYLCVAEDGDTFQVKAADVESLLTQIDRYLSGQPVQS